MKRTVPHAPGCNRKEPIHRFKCQYCRRTVGWCMGAYDAVERVSGPICDECFCRLSDSDASLIDLAETLEQMEQSGPVFQRAAANYRANVKKILAETAHR